MTVSVTACSECTVMVISVFAGPVPKNAGSVVETTSPSFTLSKVTVFVVVGASVAVVNRDWLVLPAGRSIVASGLSSTYLLFFYFLNQFYAEKFFKLSCKL